MITKFSNLNIEKDIELPINIEQLNDEVKKICNAVDKHPKVLEWISLTYPKDYSRGSFE